MHYVTIRADDLERGRVFDLKASVCVCMRARVCEGPSAPCLLSAVIECVLKLSIFGDYLILAAGD